MYETSRTRELYHHGVKGMKWGVRKKRPKSSDHNKNYSDKQRKNDRAFYGDRGEKRINKKLNEGYGLRGARHLEVERRDRRAKAKKAVKKGVAAVSSAMGTIGTYYIVDQVFYGGAGTRAVKTAVKYTGRAVVTAWMKAHGATDIHWYDN